MGAGAESHGGVGIRAHGTDGVRRGSDGYVPESMMPINHKPEHIMVMIAGGAVKHSHFFPTFPNCNVVSGQIKQ